MPDLLLVGLASMFGLCLWTLVWTWAYLGLVGLTAAAVTVTQSQGGGWWRGALAEPLMLLSFVWTCQVCEMGGLLRD